MALFRSIPDGLPGVVVNLGHNRVVEFVSALLDLRLLTRPWVVRPDTHDLFVDGVRRIVRRNLPAGLLFPVDLHAVLAGLQAVSGVERVFAALDVREHGMHLRILGNEGDGSSVYRFAVQSDTPLHRGAAAAGAATAQGQTKNRQKQSRQGRLPNAREDHRDHTSKSREPKGKDRKSTRL